MVSIMRKVTHLSSVKGEKYVHFLDRHLVNPYGNTVNVVVVGAGGNGTQILSGLARMNVALMALGHPGLHVHVFDGDTVSEANVGRQLFAVPDIGLNKATVQVTRINNFFGFQWKSYPRMFTKNSIDDSSQDIPLVISAVDTADARILIRKQIEGKCLYFLDVGNTKNTGQCVIGTVEPIAQPKRRGRATALDYIPTVTDLYDLKEQEKRSGFQGPSCSIEQALRRQDLFINQQVATCALRLLWEGFRTGKLEINGYIVNQNSAISERAMPLDPVMWKRMGWERKVSKTEEYAEKKAA